MADLPEPLASLERDHRLIEATVAEARDAVTAAAAGNADADEALATLRGFEAFMDTDLDLHIAKEEQVLFPALRSLGAETGIVIDDLIVQHDSVRERHAALQRTLEALDSAHEEVSSERLALSERLASVPGPAALAEAREIVRRLDSILQGHFFDEEDGLFEPAAAVLSPPALAELALAMAELTVVP